MQEDVYEEFVKKAVAEATSRKVGDPFADGIQQGPQVIHYIIFAVCACTPDSIEQVPQEIQYIIFAVCIHMHVSSGVHA